MAASRAPSCGLLLLSDLAACAARAVFPPEALRWEIVLLEQVGGGRPFAFEALAYLPGGRPAEGTRFTGEIRLEVARRGADAAYPRIRRRPPSRSTR